MLENVLLSNVVELKCVFNMYSNELCVQKFLLLINKCDEERWKPRPSFRQKINSFVILDPLFFFFPKKPPCKWNKQDREKLSPLIITTIITRRFFYKKTFMIKVIQNFMEITLCFNCFSEKTCWKMLFNILFSVSIFDTMFLFWFIGGCCLVAIAWSRTRFQMSTKKGQNLNLKNFFQQVLLEYVFI